MKRLKKRKDGNKIMFLKKWIQSLLIIIIFILIFSFCSIIETTYTRKATIIQIKDNTILMKDENNYVWEFNTNEFSVGDEVKLTLDNNHTDLIIKDDKIKKIKK